MSTVLVVHDVTFTDVDKMMNNIEYVARHSKAFDGDYTIYCEPDSPLTPLLKEAGIPHSTENFPEEPDFVISFIYDLNDGSKASELAMNQWKSRRPVWPFQVLKP